MRLLQLRLGSREDDHMRPRMSGTLSHTLSKFRNLESMQEDRRNVNLTWQADSQGPGWRVPALEPLDGSRWQMHRDPWTKRSLLDSDYKRSLNLQSS